MKNDKKSSDSAEDIQDINLDLNLVLEPAEKHDPLEELRGKCSVVYMTPATGLINDGIVHAASVSKGGKDGFIRANTIKVNLLQENGNTTAQLTREENKTTSIIGLQNIERFVGDKGTDIKIFNFVLTEMNDQHVVVNGKLAKDHVDISMQRMVDLGICNSLRAARRSFSAAADLLSNIKLRGAIYLNNETIDQSKMRVLFIGSDERNKMGSLLLNPRPDVKWGLITRFQMVLPNYYYKLSNRGGNLFLYVLQVSRQRIKILLRKKKNYIKIPFESIRDKLGLPAPKDTLNPGRDIRKVILDAIDEIMIVHSEELKNRDLNLLAQHKFCANLRTVNIEEFLKLGFLRVKIKGSLLEYIKQVGGAKTREKKPPKKVEAEVSDA